MAVKSVTVSGSVIKQVKCEKCQCDYAYEMFGQNTRTADNSLGHAAVAGGLIGAVIAVAVTAASGGTSEDRLRAQAQANLDRSLAKRCEPVPCPACGWYQAEMVRESRTRYRKPLLGLGAVLLTIGAAGEVILLSMNSSPNTVSPIAFAIAGAILLAGLAVIAWRWSMQRAYDINQGYPSPRPPYPGSPPGFDIKNLPKVATMSPDPTGAPGIAPPPPTTAGWYYLRGDRPEGPVTWTDLKHLAATGALDPQDLVFATGTPEWVEAGTVPELLPAARVGN
jgi:hypothetical protein